MVANPCLPSVVPMNEAVRLWMKLDCHVHVSILAVVGDQQVREM